jgi:hypothetical protein
MFKPKCLTKNALRGIIGTGCYPASPSSDQRSTSSESREASLISSQTHLGGSKAFLAEIESTKPTNIDESSGQLGTYNQCRRKQQKRLVLNRMI